MAGVNFILEDLIQTKYSGIWTKDMKRNTNLQQPQVAKAIKNLEARHLIQAVKSVAVRL